MKRKLKPLVQILNENPAHHHGDHGEIIISGIKSVIDPRMFNLFGKSIELEGQRFIGINGTWFIEESWLEPLPKEEKWYQVVYHSIHSELPENYHFLVNSFDHFYNLTHKTKKDFKFVHLSPFNNIGE